MKHESQIGYSHYGCPALVPPDEPELDIDEMAREVMEDFERFEELIQTFGEDSGARTRLWLAQDEAIGRTDAWKADRFDALVADLYDAARRCVERDIREGNI